MKKIASVLSGLALMATLTACGGGASEEDLLQELKDQGFSDSLADCVLGEVKSNAGSVQEYADLDADDQQTMAAEAGAECAQSASPEELSGAVDGLDAELDDPALRDSLITGMTSQGLTDEQANCILDAAIDAELTPSDFIDAEKIGPIAQTCQ